MAADSSSWTRSPPDGDLNSTQSGRRCGSCSSRPRVRRSRRCRVHEKSPGGAGSAPHPAARAPSCRRTPVPGGRLPPRGQRESRPPGRLRDASPPGRRCSGITMSPDEAPRETLKTSLDSSASASKASPNAHAEPAAGAPPRSASCDRTTGSGRSAARTRRRAAPAAFRNLTLTRRSPTGPMVRHIRCGVMTTLGTRSRSAIWANARTNTANGGDSGGFQRSADESDRLVAHRSSGYQQAGVHLFGARGWRAHCDAAWSRNRPGDVAPVNTWVVRPCWDVFVSEDDRGREEDLADR